MSRISLYILTVLPLLILCSCKEDFSPKTDFRERYVLNCVLRADTNYQIAVVAKSYDVPGYNGADNTVDPFLSGVDLKIWYKDSVMFFHDTAVARNDTSRYKTPVHYYYLRNFKPKPGDSVEIEALLPNGKRLRSKMDFPVALELGLGNDNIIPAQNKSTFDFSWINTQSSLVYEPKFKIVYFHKENGQDIKYTAEVPLTFYKKDNQYIPIYPLPSNKNYLSVDLDAINRVLNSISEGDPDKGSYSILAGLIDVIAYDKNLSSYYSSTALQLDSYSLRLDESDFTNVTGGYGIFGGYFRQNFSVLLDKQYILSFGYVPVINN